MALVKRKRFLHVYRFGITIGRNLKVIVPTISVFLKEIL